MDLKDRFDDMGIDELLIYIIMINVTGCKEVEANNAAVQIREQLKKRIDSRIVYLTHTKERMRIKGYVSSVLDALQNQIDEGNKIKEMFK